MSPTAGGLGNERVRRILERFPEAVRPHLEESIGRLVSVRTPRSALAALEDEVEHILRVGIPLFLKRPLLASATQATVLAGAAGALAAAAEEADELAAIFSLGSTVAPGTATVLVIGFLATVAEVYAATCARAQQLAQAGLEVDPQQLAAEVRRAVIGDLTATSGPRWSARRSAKGGLGRLGTRWAVGAVPVVGVLYASWDSGRTVRAVLRLPLPDTKTDVESARPTP